MRSTVTVATLLSWNFSVTSRTDVSFVYLLIYQTNGTEPISDKYACQNEYIDKTITFNTL